MLVWAATVDFFMRVVSVKSQKLKFTQANIFLKSVDAMGYG